MYKNEERAGHFARVSCRCLSPVQCTAARCLYRARPGRAAHRSAHFTLGCQQSARAKNAKIVRLCKTLIVCRLAGPSSAQLCKQEAGTARQHTASLAAVMVMTAPDLRPVQTVHYSPLLAKLNATYINTPTFLTMRLVPGGTQQCTLRYLLGNLMSTL